MSLSFFSVFTNGMELNHTLESVFRFEPYDELAKRQMMGKWEVGTGVKGIPPGGSGRDDREGKETGVCTAPRVGSIGNESIRNLEVLSSEMR